jgi:hypothetical protein
VSAYREGDRIVVLIPDRFTAAEERLWVGRMVGRLTRRDAGRAARSDATLAGRAAELNRTFLDGRATPVSVRWVPPMRSRWASCTPAHGTIRVSNRVATMPDWVLDYVLVHELVHLLIPGHGPDFWALVERYPRTERARGYLDGVSAAANLGLDQEADETSDDTDEATGA